MEPYDIRDLGTEEWCAIYERHDNLLFYFKSELVTALDGGALLLILGKVTRNAKTYYLCIPVDDDEDTQPVSVIDRYGVA